MPVEKIDPATAQQELETAKARKATSSLDLTDKARAEERARALLRLASKPGSTH
jgi:hypothetical protein